MKLLLCLFAFAVLGVADPVTDVVNSQIALLDADVLPLAVKMPANKYGFTPAASKVAGSNFEGVRTFGEQARHIATVLYMVSAAALGEAKAPADLGPDDSGPRNLTTKEQILPYLQGAVAYAKKAAAFVNQKNAFDQINGPFGGKSTRLNAISIAGWHSMDHYGQMVVYARLNGVKPGQ
jgi:hypothetical protein